MKFCIDAYFYEMVCLKLSWNPGRAPLRLTLVTIMLDDKNTFESY